jgi:hypothetical protein
LAELRCENCGKPAEPTPLGTLLCATCRERYREFHFAECGERVMYLNEVAANYPELAASVCESCHMRERVAGRLARLLKHDQPLLKKNQAADSVAGLQSRLGPP